VWGVKTAIGKISRRSNGKRVEYYRLWIRSSEELKKLLRIILPELKIPSMLPKIILLYKNSKLQQRWISEIIEKTKFSREITEKYLIEKQQRYKRFQKMI